MFVPLRGAEDGLLLLILTGFLLIFSFNFCQQCTESFFLFFLMFSYGKDFLKIVLEVSLGSLINSFELFMY